MSDDLNQLRDRLQGTTPLSVRRHELAGRDFFATDNDAGTENDSSATDRHLRRLQREGRRRTFVVNPHPLGGQMAVKEHDPRAFGDLSRLQSLPRRLNPLFQIRGARSI